MSEWIKYSETDKWIEELEENSKEYYGDASQEGNLHHKGKGIFYRPHVFAKQILIGDKEFLYEELEALINHMKRYQK